MFVLSVNLHDPIEDTIGPSFNDCPRGPLQEATIWPEYERRVLKTKKFKLRFVLHWTKQRLFQSKRNKNLNK
jgi:hypothetical protein